MTGLAPNVLLFSSTAKRGRCPERAEGVRAVLRALKNFADVQIWAAPSDPHARATSPAFAVEEKRFALYGPLSIATKVENPNG